MGIVSSRKQQHTYKDKVYLAKESAKIIIKNKAKFIDSKTYNERYDICTKCEFLVNSRCKKCGCFMKIKTKFKAMECPIKKW